VKLLRRITIACVLSTSISLFVPCLPVFAQTAGNPVIYGSSGVTSSSAVVDASVLSGGDLCAQVNYAVAHASAGTVIDARGINATNPKSSLVCASGTPWGGGSNTNTANPATILLPAGTIQIFAPWVLPSGTRLQGEGSGLTVIQAQTAAANPMIQMGAASPVCPNNVCTGIGVEDLTLDGNAVAGVSGIVNGYSQEMTYVKHVNLFQILGMGLQVLAQGSGSAQNSGPYSDIRFDTAGQAPSPATVCAQILGTLPTRGIHGLTCVSNGTPSAAVLLDASNNSLEDVHIQGFQDGILIGKNGTAVSNVLASIAGGSGVNNVVHIAAVQGKSVADEAIVGVTNGGGAAHTIQDDLTGTTLSDAAVAIYAFGEPVTAGTHVAGYSRFTTSPNAANWSFGSNSLPPNTPCSNIGSLYSNTAGTAGGNNTWYVCTGNGSSATWADIE